MSRCLRSSPGPAAIDAPAEPTAIDAAAEPAARVAALAPPAIAAATEFPALGADDEAGAFVNVETAAPGDGTDGVAGAGTEAPVVVTVGVATAAAGAGALLTGGRTGSEGAVTVAPGTGGLGTAGLGTGGRGTGDLGTAGLGTGGLGTGRAPAPALARAVAAITPSTTEMRNRIFRDMCAKTHTRTRTCANLVRQPEISGRAATISAGISGMVPGT